MIGKIRFGLEANGHTYGSINAENWRAWNFRVAGPRRHRGRPHHQDLGGPRQDAVHHRRQLRGADPPPARGAAPHPGRGQQPRRRHRPQAGQPRLRLSRSPRLAGYDRGSGRSLPHAVRDAVARALAEDLTPLGDLTSALLPGGRDLRRGLRARGATACWPAPPARPRRSPSSTPSVEVAWAAADGDAVAAGVRRSAP